MIYRILLLYLLDIQEDSRALEPYPIESRLWGMALFVFTGQPTTTG
nr:MAG TPA: hypothetical protein [Caudoviricetes sp.]